jgi:hypothetical protein
MQTAVEDYLSRLCCPPVITYNFDVTANWATGDSSYPVTSQASFQTFLASRTTNNLTSIVITDFNLVGNRLQCNLAASGTILDLTVMSVTQVISLGNILGLQSLYLNTNQLTLFNPTLPLPTSLQILTLYRNEIGIPGYAASEPWANGMHNAPIGGTINVTNNVNNPAGTNFQTILTNKGWLLIL